MRRDDVIARLKKTEPALRAFGVNALYLFGSHARDEAGPDRFRSARVCGRQRASGALCKPGSRDRDEESAIALADDTIVGFQHRQDAERFQIDLKERLAKFALNLHPEKTVSSSSADMLQDAGQSGARASRRRSISWGLRTIAAPERTAPASNSGARHRESD
jgi:hypothetical protein